MNPLAYFISIIFLFSTPLLASVLKSTASSSGSAVSGISGSPPSSSSGRWSNSSQATTPITSHASQSSDSPYSQTGCPDGGCDVPVHFAASQFITVPAPSTRSNSTLSSELQNECVLWDSSCSGNKTEAAIQFFKEQNGTSEFLLSGQDACFRQESGNCSSAILSEYALIKDWMRSPQCQSVLSSISPTSTLASTILTPYALTQTPVGSCCGSDYVDFSVGNVDVFFWPEPDANASCLNVVGTDVLPLQYGATTSGSAVYWGCTTQAWGWNTRDFGELTYTDGDTYYGRTKAAHDYGPETFTTAILTSLNSVTFKSYLTNPWSSQPCPDSSTVPGSAASGTASGAGIHARAHPISISPSLRKRNGTRASTVVSGQYTL